MGTIAQQQAIVTKTSERQERILTPDAMRFVTELSKFAETRRRELLEKRRQRQHAIDAGRLPDFLPETAEIRRAEWKVAPIPADIQDRRVEITGPVDRKMVINALNSGANVFMADFEDSNSPTWDNNIEGQINLCDAVRGDISYVSPEGKQYELGPRPAVLFVRPRGWHLIEKHFLVDGAPVSGSLFDFGLFFFHNAKALIAKGTGPYFYLPKMESHLEARLWNDVFNFAQDELDIPRGSIRATVLIETILAAFEMDEILYELRDHSAGLNCGRWDYIFSFIKKFRNDPKFLLPDRATVTMDREFLSAYAALLVKTCHRRGAHAMGGMAAQIPVRSDAAADREALQKVREDKEREVRNGHDGTWVAHPGLVPVAKAVFDAMMPENNQLDNLRDDVTVTERDLLSVPSGKITEKGLRTNLSVALQYLESWLRGIGAVPIFHLMEDTATAEISRAQLWQWIHHRATLDDGRRVTRELVASLMDEELNLLRQSVGDDRYLSGAYDQAAALLRELTLSDNFTEFLTIPAYEILHSIDER